jgi:hypothetical protein
MSGWNLVDASEWVCLWISSHQGNVPRTLVATPRKHDDDVVGCTRKYGRR